MRACVCVCVCVCVCMCVCAYVYVCINKTNQNIVIFATCTTQYRVLTKFQKFINWKFKKILFIHDANSYLFEILLHFLVH